MSYQDLRNIFNAVIDILNIDLDLGIIEFNILEYFIAHFLLHMFIFVLEYIFEYKGQEKEEHSG